MNRTKELQQENNRLEAHLEKMLVPEEQARLTDIIVALRGADITVLEQEQVRRDLNQMAIEGRNRGQSLTEIFGTDDRALVDALIEAIPKRTTRERWLSHVGLIGLSVGSLLLIRTLVGLAENLRRPFAQWFLIVSVGDLLMMALIMGVSIFLVNQVIGSVFKPSGKNRDRLLILFLIAVSIVIMALAVLSRIWTPLRTEVFSVHPVTLGVASLLLLWIGKRADI